MNRLLVALLAAFDAALAAVGGVAAAFAPLTLLWVFALGTGADAGALWPASAVVWQLGHLVPVEVRLPDEYLAAAGIDPSAASFTLSLAPLLFGVFTAVFAARSGTRAARAGEPLTGAVSGAVVFTALAGVVALTGSAELAAVQPWQAVLLPALFYLVPLAAAAGIGAWSADAGAAARLRRRVESAGEGWGEVPGLVVRGTAVAGTALVGIGALVLAAAVFVRMGQIIALFQASHVDGVGVVVLAAGQFAYLPTLVVWALAFTAGPGFALGVDTAVSPSGTQLGVVPGLPILGAVPESTTPWLLLLVLLPVGAGAVAGWVARSRFATRHPQHEAYGPRVVTLAGITVLTAAVAALLAVLARGALGPGRMAQAGPEPGPVAAVIGLEVLVGAAILLLSPRRAPSRPDADHAWRRAGHEPAASAFVDHAGQPVPFADAHPLTGPSAVAAPAASPATATLAALPTLPANAFSGGSGGDSDTATLSDDPDATGPLPFLADEPGAADAGEAGTPDR
jgi:hypothetical protein